MTKTNYDIHVNKKYKDTVFRKLFGENKENALSLYNAVNHTSYTDPDDLEYTTLEDVIYMKYKNDVSFLIDKTLSLYEHQSSYNPNMPLRGFLYYADLYRKLIHQKAGSAYPGLGDLRWLSDAGAYHFGPTWGRE